MKTIFWTGYGHCSYGSRHRDGSDHTIGVSRKLQNGCSNTFREVAVAAKNVEPGLQTTFAVEEQHRRA